MKTRILLTIGLLIILAGFVSFAILVSQLTGDAVDAALKANSTPDTMQRVTAVCIGLNIGACRTSQHSTSTLPAGGYPGANPWPVIVLATAIICPVVLAAAWRWFGPAEGQS